MVHAVGGELPALQCDTFGRAAFALAATARAHRVGARVHILQQSPIVHCLPVQAPAQLPVLQQQPLKELPKGLAGAALQRRQLQLGGAQLLLLLAWLCVHVPAHQQLAEDVGCGPVVHSLQQ